MRRFLLVPLLLLTACAGGDKYPYPPQFVSTQELPAPQLPAPPKQGSATFTHELDSIVKIQSGVSDSEKKTIVTEDHIAPEMLVTPVLGSHYTREAYPALYTLLEHAASDAWRECDSEQDYWQSPRPFTVDARVQLIAPSIKRPGYPSGHTTTNAVWAYILSDLFPEKRAALFARAYATGHHRIEGGVHFPHDVEGGKRMAAILYQKMRVSPAYQAELKAAKMELNATALNRGKVTDCITPRGAAMSPCH